MKIDLNVVADAAPSASTAAATAADVKAIRLILLPSLAAPKRLPVQAPFPNTGATEACAFTDD